MFVVGCLDDIKLCCRDVPKEVLNDLVENCVNLDYSYGINRDYQKVGGYSVILQNVNDIKTFKKRLDICSYYRECASKVGKSSYVSALYVVNDDFSVMVYLPIAIAPEIILNSVE